MKKTKELSVIAQVESSNINRVGYDEKDSTLYVEFKNKTLYTYSGVSSEVFDEMKKSESVGVYLNKKIKGNFEYSKLEDTEIKSEKVEEYKKQEVKNEG